MNEPLLAWTDELALGQATMDDTHREFVAQLNRMAAALAEWFPQHAASMDAVLALYMTEIGFAPDAAAAVAG